MTLLLDSDGAHTRNFLLVSQIWSFDMLVEFYVDGQSVSSNRAYWFILIIEGSNQKRNGDDLED